MAMTKLPKGTGAGAGTGVSRAAASTGGPTGVVASGTRGAKRGFPGKNTKPAGSQRLSPRSASVTRAPAGQTKGTIPSKTPPAGRSPQGDNGAMKPTSTAFGSDKARAGGRKVGGPISSGGGSFGQS